MMSCPDLNVPDCTVAPIDALGRMESAAHSHSILVISTKQQQHYCKNTCCILSKTKMLSRVPFKSTRATTHYAFPSKGQILYFPIPNKFHEVLHCCAVAVKGGSIAMDRRANREGDSTHV